MGKLINMMQTNLFGKKKPLEEKLSPDTTTTTTLDGTTSSSLVHAPPSIFTINNSNNRADHKTKQSSDFLRELFSPADVLAPTTTTTTTLTAESEENGGKVHVVLEEEEEGRKSMESKVYELERYYIFEQNNTIDKYESEKAEMQAKHCEEKLLMKRAYEHEKDELLKEIERKDKMLFELTKIMKEEYGNKLERQRTELSDVIDGKERLLTSVGDALKSLVGSLTTLIDDVELTENIADFRQHLTQCEDILSSIMTSSTNEPGTTNRKIDTMTASDQPKSITTPSEGETETFSDSPLNEKRKQTTPKVVTRTLSDCIGLKSNECCRTTDCCRLQHSTGDDIQHELAQAYRKQKCELLRLFNTEKEEYKKAINKDKDIFERETREEYIQRMAVERKAWQETIEDLERELSIVKYERQQMDTNYCVGMDQLKMEFEREKNTIHRRYKESCMLWKKDYEEKMRNVKIVEGIEKKAGGSNHTDDGT